MERTPSRIGFARANRKITVIQDADLFAADGVVEESPALADISSASIRGHITLGPRAVRACGAWGTIPTRRGCSRPVRPALEELQKREPESNVQIALEDALAHLAR